MRYVVKIRNDNIWYYASEVVLFKVQELEQYEYNLSFFGLTEKNARKLMLKLMSMYKDTINEIAVIKLSNYPPYVEYETVEYRNFN